MIEQDTYKSQRARFPSHAHPATGPGRLLAAAPDTTAPARGRAGGGRGTGRRANQAGRVSLRVAMSITKRYFTSPFCMRS